MNPNASRNGVTNENVNYSYSMLVDNPKKNPLTLSREPQTVSNNNNTNTQPNIHKQANTTVRPRTPTGDATSIYKDPRRVQKGKEIKDDLTMSLQEPKKEKSIFSQVAASAASITSAAAAASVSTKQAAKAAKASFSPLNGFSSAIAASAGAGAATSAGSAASNQKNADKAKKHQIEDINSIESRRVHTWVRDSTIHNCYSCKVGFTMINRKHHCRLCGRIFCAECTKYRQKIPIFLANYLPKRNDESPSFSRLISDSDKTLGTTFKNIKTAISASNNGTNGSNGSNGSNGTNGSNSLTSSQGASNTTSNTPNITANPTNPTNSRYRDYGTMSPKDQLSAKSPTTTILMGQYMDETREAREARISPSVSSDSLDTNDDKSSSNPSSNPSNPHNSDNNDNIRSRLEVENCPQRLCKPCFIRLNELTHLRYLIDLFAVSGTTIKDLKTYSLVCKDWSQIASYHLSSFREMQYYLPNHRFSRYDRQMLWDNRMYLLNHGTWMTQLIRSIDYSEGHAGKEGDEKVKELISLLGLVEQEKTIVKVEPEIGLNNLDEALNQGFNLDVDFRNRKPGRNHATSASTSIQGTVASAAAVATVATTIVQDATPVNNTNLQDAISTTSTSTNAITNTNTNDLEINSSKRLLEANPNRPRVSCWSLMCTRTCQKSLRPEDAVILLDYHTQSPELRVWAMSELLKIDLDELRCYLPILVHHIRYESIEQSIIGKGLINLVSKKRYKGLSRPYQLLLANDLYWQLTVAIENRSCQQTYRYFLEQFCNNMDASVLAIIFKGKAANSLLFSTTTNVSGLSNSSSNSSLGSSSKSSANTSKTYKKFTEEQIKHVLSLNLKHEPIFSPTNPFLDYLAMDINKVKQTDSNSKPVILPFRIKAPTGTTLDKNLLYKNEDLRKDKIIMNLIKLANLILKREENLDLGLITYEICPTTANTGFLEMVPKSKTLYDIKERLNLSINNYIDSYNDSISVQSLRTRFVRSCAGYCVITYLLGIGDRHLDNIMITEDGYIFHIDYGFILGADPKPMTKPKMRLTDDMVSAMGGADSKYYQEFKEISNRVYNCLRRHIGLFISMLELLTDADPPIENKVEITKDLLLREIYKRFVPGETYSEAQILLETEIHNSNLTYTHAINDFFHYHAKEKTLQTALGSTFKSIKGFFK